MSKIGIIAYNTFKESVRDKILYNIGAVGLLLIVFSIILGDWSVFDREHVVKSFSLSVLSFSGVLLSIFVGIGLVQKEIQKKTVLTLLSKPIKRWQFIVGKFLGLQCLLTAQFFIIAGMMFFVLWAAEAHPNFALLQAVILLWFQLTIVVSVAILFSTFTSSHLAALFTFGVYLAGNLSGEILKQVEGMLHRGEISMSEFSGMLYVSLAKGIYFIFPNLEQYNITTQILHSGAIDVNVFFHLMAFAFAYSMAFILLAIWWFDRKDFI